MVSTELYNSLLWYRVLPEIGKYVKKTTAANKQGSNEWAATVKISQTLAIEAILRDPLQYVVHVLSNYYGMWESAFTYEGTMSGMTRQFYQINQSVVDKSWFASLAVARSLYHDPSVDALFQKQQGDVAIADTMWQEFTFHKEEIIIIVFAASLIIFYFFSYLRKLTPSISGLIFLSFSIHIYDMMVASCISAISRYAAAFEPILLSLAFGILVGTLVGRGSNRREFHQYVTARLFVQQVPKPPSWSGIAPRR